MLIMLKLRSKLCKNYFFFNKSVTYLVRHFAWQWKETVLPNLTAFQIQVSTNSSYGVMLARLSAKAQSYWHENTLQHILFIFIWFMTEIMPKTLRSGKRMMVLTVKTFYEREKHNNVPLIPLICVTG